MKVFIRTVRIFLVTLAVAVVSCKKSDLEDEYLGEIVRNLDFLDELIEAECSPVYGANAYFESTAKDEFILMINVSYDSDGISVDDKALDIFKGGFDRIRSNDIPYEVKEIEMKIYLKNWSLPDTSENGYFFRYINRKGTVLELKEEGK